MSAQHLQQLRELARDVPEVSQWLEDGLQRWKENGEPLDRALALAGARAKIERNRALIQAARLLDPEQQHTAWKLAGLLEFSIRRFESLVWPRDKVSGKTQLSPIDHALYQAFISGAEMIRTQRKLFDLIR